MRESDEFSYPEIDLVRLIERIIQRKEQGWVISDLRIEDVRADLVYRTDDQIFVVEVKRVVPQTAERLNDLLAQLSLARESMQRRWTNRQVFVVLAIPGILAIDKMSVLAQTGITVWDRDWIVASAVETGLEQDAFRLFGNIREVRPVVSRASQLANALALTGCGRAAWSSYQKLGRDIMEYLFCPALEAPIYESMNASRINRRDFVMPNYASDGFWHFLRQHYRADYVVVDAKNLCNPVTKTNVLQLANYLSGHGTGLLGIILSRKGLDPAAKYISREQWVLHNKMILSLNDDDVLQMLATAGAGDRPEMLIRQKIEDFRLGM